MEQVEIVTLLPKSPWDLLAPCQTIRPSALEDEIFGEIDDLVLKSDQYMDFRIKIDTPLAYYHCGEAFAFSLKGAFVVPFSESLI